MYETPLSDPMSWIVTMLGWFRADADRASFSKRLQPLRIRGQRLRQDLDRHLAREPRVPRPVDLPHPARAERRDDLVGTEARAGGKAQLPDSVHDPEVRHQVSEARVCIGLAVAGDSDVGNHPDAG